MLFTASLPLNGHSCVGGRSCGRGASPHPRSCRRGASPVQGEHPEAWIGPWRKAQGGKWQPDWGRGMESEYRSMRQVMEQVLLREFSVDPEKTKGKPPWKVAGSGASGSANKYSFSGLEGAEQGLHREGNNELDRSGGKPAWKAPGSGAAGSASRYSGSGMHTDPYIDPAGAVFSWVLIHTHAAWFIHRHWRVAMQLQSGQWQA